MKKQYSAEEKRVYFRGLREQWKKAKAIAEVEGDEIKAIIANYGLNISVSGYIIVSGQMRAKGLEGLPYLDCKTFQGWIDNGFKVRKGEHSTIKGITWIEPGNGKETESKEEEETDKFVFPKEYHLFHRTQVEEAA